MWHVWVGQEAPTDRRLENPQETDHYKDTGFYAKITLKWIFKT